MPLTATNRSGDGINDVFLDTFIVLPDAGSSVVVGGSVQAVGASLMPITGSPLTAPAVPGSSFINWNIQVDVTTGAATVQTSALGGADPAPINGNNVIIFRQLLTFGVSGAALDSDTSSTPDQPV